MKRYIVIVDIETTGFLNTGGKIIEVAAVKLDLVTGKVNKLIDYVCHETSISETEINNSWIIKNSNITLDEVKYSINLKRLIPKIQRIADEFPITAYNRNFDIPFLTSRGVEFKELYPCPMLELTPIIKLPSARGRTGEYKWPNVEEAYRYFCPDAKYVEAHRAGDDALHEAKIVYELHKLKEKEDNKDSRKIKFNLL